VSDLLFGPRLWSLESFVKSSVFSMGLLALAVIVLFPYDNTPVRWFRHVRLVWFGGLFISLVPDYVSLIQTRWLLRISALGSNLSILALLVVDTAFTVSIGFVAVLSTTLVFSRAFYPDLATEFSSVVRHFRWKNPAYVIWFVPAFATSIWLWLYAVSGFLLKAAKRFDIGFQWFNRRFDMEKKPL